MACGEVLSKACCRQTGWERPRLKGWYTGCDSKDDSSCVELVWEQRLPPYAERKKPDAEEEHMLRGSIHGNRQSRQNRVIEGRLGAFLGQGMGLETGSTETRETRERWKCVMPLLGVLDRHLAKVIDLCH